MTASEKLAEEIVTKALALMECGRVARAEVKSVSKNKGTFGCIEENVYLILGDGVSMAITIMTDEKKK